MSSHLRYTTLGLKYIGIGSRGHGGEPCLTDAYHWGAVKRAFTNDFPRIHPGLGLLVAMEVAREIEPPYDPFKGAPLQVLQNPESNPLVPKNFPERPIKSINPRDKPTAAPMPEGYRPKNDAGVMDVVAGHHFTPEEIASIRPDLYRIARESKLVRDKLISMKFDAPELSAEALEELGRTDMFELVEEGKP